MTTTTTQLRLLRASTHAHPTHLPIRASPRLTAQRRHLPPCLPQPHASRLFSTSPRLFQAQPPPRQTRDSITTTPSTTPASPPDAANPPATTRPPSLVLPPSEPGIPSFSNLFARGKAYLRFYKTGLRNIYHNTRMVWSLDSNGGPRGPDPGTRAALLLHRRWRHDIRRIPIFALVLLICGEFTPLVVLGIPRLAPYTCRIPRQVDKLQRRSEIRRRRLALESTWGETARVGSPAAVARIARSLGLISAAWDLLALPDGALALLARRRVRGHVAFLEEDSVLLERAGGTWVLEDDEVRLACEDRGLDVVGVPDWVLRPRLESWVKAATAPDLPPHVERSTLITALLLAESERQDSDRADEVFDRAMRLIEQGSGH